VKSTIPDEDWVDPITGLTLAEMEARLKARRDKMLKETFTEKREEREPAKKQNTVVRRIPTRRRPSLFDGYGSDEFDPDEEFFE